LGGNRLDAVRRVFYDCGVAARMLAAAERALIASVQFASCRAFPSSPRRAFGTICGLGFMKIKLMLLGAVAVLGGVACVCFREYLSVEVLADQQDRLRALWQASPVVVFAAAFAAYMVASWVPGISGKSVVYGWLFGFWPAVVLVSFASTTAATLAFLFSRYLFRDVLKAKFGERLEKIDETLKREGPFCLFTLRLIPVVPFSFINLAMGVTPMRTRTFWWVSQLAMLPANCLWVYAGSRLPSLRHIAEGHLSDVVTPQLIIAITLLAVFPVVVRMIAGWMRPAVASA
jgi:uncharacterized membrane protein YdjX (TVP38/TMEM64 family)